MEHKKEGGMTRWTAQQIQEAVKAGKRTVVTKEIGGTHRDLFRDRAAKLEGSYIVTETPFEIIVDIGSQKKPG